MLLLFPAHSFHITCGSSLLACPVRSSSRPSCRGAWRHAPVLAPRAVGLCVSPPVSLHRLSFHLSRLRLLLAFHRFPIVMAFASYRLPPSSSSRFAPSPRRSCRETGRHHRLACRHAGRLYLLGVRCRSYLKTLLGNLLKICLGKLLKTFMGNLLKNDWTYPSFYMSAVRLPAVASLCVAAYCPVVLSLSLVL